MSVIKHQVHRAMNATFEAAFGEADVEMRESFMRPDVDEGVNSFLERRPPVFSELSQPR
jgi:enoyl-CoA hydratase/carnithine racemase